MMLGVRCYLDQRGARSSKQGECTVSRRGASFPFLQASGLIQRSYESRIQARLKPRQFLS